MTSQSLSNFCLKLQPEEIPECSGTKSNVTALLVSPPALIVVHAWQALKARESLMARYYKK